MQIGHIYLLWPTEYLITNQYIYKIGKTSQIEKGGLKRPTKDYGKKCYIFLTIQTLDVDNIETKIKQRPPKRRPYLI